VRTWPQYAPTAEPSFPRPLSFARSAIVDDLRSGDLVELPIDVDLITGPVGLTMRADASPTLPTQIIRDAIRAVAAEIGLTSADRAS
jgi:hypothetical protein